MDFKTRRNSVSCHPYNTSANSEY